MKVQFDRDQGHGSRVVSGLSGSRRAVTPVDEAVEHVEHARRRWLQWTLIGAASFLLLWVLWLWWTSGRIIAAGLVVAQTSSIDAPTDCRVSGLYVQSGDRVQAGDPLLILVSDSAQRQAEQLLRQIEQEEAVLVELRTRLDRLESTPSPDSLSGLQRLQERLSQLDREAVDLDAEHQSQTHRLLREIRLAQAQLAEAQASGQGQENRLAATRILRELEAATASEEALADEHARKAVLDENALRTRLLQLEGELAERTRQHQVRQAQLREDRQRAEADLGQVRAVFKAEADQALAAAKSAFERSQSRLNALRQDHAHWKRLAGPNTYRAPDQGVVTKLLVADGATLAPGARILELAQTGHVWIEGYVPSDQAALISDTSTVAVYPAHRSDRLEATCTASGRLEVSLPEAISARLPGLNRATQLRIDLINDQHGLTPGNIVDVVIRP